VLVTADVDSAQIIGDDNVYFMSVQKRKRPDAFLHPAALLFNIALLAR
jgi:hypothetical protein